MTIQEIQNEIKDLEKMIRYAEEEAPTYSTRNAILEMQTDLRYYKAKLHKETLIAPPSKQLVS